jgi:hypothetical protein
MVSATSCNRINNFWKDQVGEEVLAKVGDAQLTISEISTLSFPDNPGDSVLFLQSFIESWVREMVVLQAAERNLSDEMKTFNRRLEAYRRSLLIHTYQEKVLATRLDTLINLAEIEAYYAENPEDFELRYNLVQLSYITVPASHRDLPKVRQWFKSSKPADQQRLLEFCRRHAIRYNLNDSTWLRMDEVERQFSLEYASQEIFLRQNRFVELQDSTRAHLLHFTSYKIKESLSPLEFEIPRIRLILLNRRKRDRLRQLENELYEEAIKRDEVHIYMD